MESPLSAPSTSPLCTAIKIIIINKESLKEVDNKMILDISLLWAEIKDH